MSVYHTGLKSVINSLDATDAQRAYKPKNAQKERFNSHYLWSFAFIDLSQWKLCGKPFSHYEAKQMEKAVFLNPSRSKSFAS